MRQFVERLCNGEFLDKDPDEAFDCFDSLAENAQSWDTTDGINPNLFPLHVVVVVESTNLERRMT